MEFIQFHPTGMVWPPSVKGILVTESVRGDGGVLRNSEGKRFMFDYVPDVFRGQYADTEEEADRWYKDPENNKRPPELLPRDEVARAINTEVKEGRGSPHGGVFLDVSTRLPAEEITPAAARRCTTSSRSWPTSTSRPSRWRSAPRATTSWAASRSTPTPRPPACPGCTPRVRSPAACTAPTGSAATRLSDLLVFGRRAGAGAAAYIAALGDQRPAIGDADVDAPRRRRRWRRSRGRRRENPYTLHQELQQTMNDLVGIIRREGEIARRSSGSHELPTSAPDHVGVEGHRQFNPGWHLALDLRNMLLVCRCVALAALERTESRGGHTREDFPGMDPQWRGVNLVCRLDDADRPRRSR